MPEAAAPPFGMPVLLGVPDRPERGPFCPPGHGDPGLGRGWLGVLTRPHQRGVRMVRRPKITVHADERETAVHDPLARPRAAAPGRTRDPELSPLAAGLASVPEDV
ncbi:hypothetical protein Arub01_28570 [Actinomadura rubrobrunea]|uniref:Uncharacterized protein n=1 Tax=Actinomadura rubrobrunea TaxID=115335 RepID=A0A9W6PXC4_9ACTN|nr:hypothetical protein Arub01_28570 [Actinomadura rubrobrunea]